MEKDNNGNSNSGKSKYNRYSKEARGIMSTWKYDEEIDTGLGKDDQGIPDPIEVHLRKKNMGLGYGQGSKKSDEKDGCFNKNDSVGSKMNFIKFIKPEKKEVAEAVSSPPPDAEQKQKPVLEQQKPILKEKPRKRAPAVKFIIKPKKKVSEVVPEAQQPDAVSEALVPYSNDDESEVSEALVPYSCDEESEDGDARRSS